MFNLTKTYIVAAVSAAFGVAGTLALVSLGGCGKGGGGGDTLALVNGEAITMQEFAEYLKTKPRVRVVANNNVAELPVADTLAFQGLQDMISNRLLSQLAKDQGVYPSEADIAAELEFRKKLRPTFVADLNSLGQSLENIRDGIALDLARERLITKGVTVTRQEAEKFKAENAEQFTEPASVDLLGILVKTEADKAAVDKDLASGSNFSSVAVRYSKFPGAAQNGGQLGMRPLNQFDAKTKAIFEKTPVQKNTDWIQAAEGFVKFYVQKKTEAKPINLDEAQWTMLQRRIAMERGSQAIDLDKRVADKLIASTVDVKEQSLKAAWKRAYDKFMAEKKVDVATPNVGGTEEGKP